MNKKFQFKPKMEKLGHGKRSALSPLKNDL